MFRYIHNKINRTHKSILNKACGTYFYYKLYLNIRYWNCIHIKISLKKYSF